MDADCALYAEVATADELARLLPVRFESVTLAERCAYARAADPRWPASRLFPLAAGISVTGRDALVLAYDDPRAAFYFARFRHGRLQREVCGQAGRRSERGIEESWELELVAGEPRVARDLVAHHYRLTGRFEPPMIASPADDSATWLRYDAATEFATTRPRAHRRASR